MFEGVEYEDVLKVIIVVRYCNTTLCYKIDVHDITMLLDTYPFSI